MARPNKFQIMELYKEDIIDALKSTKKNVLREDEIAEVLTMNRKEWRLPASTSFSDLIQFLNNTKKITVIELEFPNKSTTRYVLNKKEISVFELGCSLGKAAYLTHYTAAFYHDLTDNIVKTVYVNQEQNEKSQSTWLPNQNDIDKAFIKPMRISNNFAIYDNRKIFLLNGKNTKNLGVLVEEKFNVTNIERTLIDIVVRPEYSGGVFEVLNIYRNAKGKVSVNKMYSYLKKLNYSYPYHQAIGFYLEQAGYKENAIKLMEKFPIDIDFYLTYEIKDKKYSDRWKLYYPGMLES